MDKRSIDAMSGSEVKVDFLIKKDDARYKNILNYMLNSLFLFSFLTLNKPT
jgi:hypothetical protein